MHLAVEIAVQDSNTRSAHYYCMKAQLFASSHRKEGELWLQARTWTKAALAGQSVAV
jgi:hypothetical protein